MPNNMRLFDILSRCDQRFNKEDILASKVEGKWIKISTSAFVEQVNYVSYGLLALGIKKDDKVASISNNRFEWNFLDMGMLQIGAVHVPIYPTITDEEYKFILNDAEVKCIFVSDKALYEKIKRIMPEVPTLKSIYTFNRVEGVNYWEEITALGKKNTNVDLLEKIKSEIKASDLATIIYTSGTTGIPKGVMLSHHNIMSNVVASEGLAPIDQHSRALSFLPLNHIYERMIIYLYLYLGTSIYYAESMETIGENIREVKPDIFTAVPRLIEKVYERIMAKGNELKGVKRKLFFWAVRLGERYEMHGKNGWWYEFQLKMANKLVFSKWREALGAKVKTIVSGSAPLQPRLARIFWAAKVYILEGYGLTETSPVVAVNCNLKPNGAKFGTVGPVLENIEVKIAEDGEILVKGPSVMMGYYKRPDLTADAIDKDGWFHTGDIGSLEEGRFLKITDRKKELFKTSGGKYIAPQPIENKFKESPFIEQIMVIGDGEKFAAALIVPSFTCLKSWCQEQNISYTTNEEMIKNIQIIQKIRSEVEIMNKYFGQVEQIKKFELIDHEWSVSTGELTPTLKVKRKIILEKYKELVEKIYRTAVPS